MWACKLEDLGVSAGFRNGFTPLTLRTWEEGFCLPGATVASGPGARVWGQLPGAASGQRAGRSRLFLSSVPLTQRASPALRPALDSKWRGCFIHLCDGTSPQGVHLDLRLGGPLAFRPGDPAFAPAAPCSTHRCPPFPPALLFSFPSKTHRLLCL